MATTTTKYLRGTIATILSTELNSMANNALVLSAAYDNSSNLDLMAELELLIANPMSTTPTANTGFSAWFLRGVDATINYEDGGTSVTPARAPDVVLPIRAVTTAQRLNRPCVIPPGTFLILIKNDATGANMASSGNTLKLRSLTFQQV